MRLSPSMTKWLKCFHLLAVSGWTGGAISLFLLHFLRFRGAEVGRDLHGVDMAAHIIDVWAIVWIGAIGCLLTGLLYSIFTNWGFFRHKWIAVKWIITIFCILSGTFYLGPWEEAMLEISKRIGAGALEDAKYLFSMYSNFWFGILQVSLLIFMMFISVFKPWRAKPKAEDGRKALAGDSE